MGRRRLFALALAAGSLLGIGLYARRSKQNDERVDLYLADGSVVSLHSDAPQAAGMLVHARDAIRAARA